MNNKKLTCINAIETQLICSITNRSRILFYCYFLFFIFWGPSIEIACCYSLDFSFNFIKRKRKIIFNKWWIMNLLIVKILNRWCQLAFEYKQDILSCVKCLDLSWKMSTYKNLIHYFRIWWYIYYFFIFKEYNIIAVRFINVLFSSEK